MQTLLNSRNIDLLEFLVRHQPLTRQAVSTHFFDQLPTRTKEVNHMNVLRRLKKQGFISTRFQSPPVDSQHPHARPKTVYTVSRENYRNIVEAIPKERGEQRDTILSYKNDIVRNRNFAPNSLEHETILSEIFLLLEKHNRFPTLQWFNTSPKHKDFYCKLEATEINEKAGRAVERYYPFNPDGFFFTITDDGLVDYFFVEYDNNTETNTTSFFKKYDAYLAYRDIQDNVFTKLVTRIHQENGLEAPEKPAFRVLFITKTSYRRDKLLMLSGDISEVSALFNFASLDDFKKDPFAPIWYNKNSVKSFLSQYQLHNQPKYKAKEHYMNHRALKQWLIDKMATEATPINLWS